MSDIRFRPFRWEDRPGQEALHGCRTFAVTVTDTSDRVLGSGGLVWIRHRADIERPYAWMDVLDESYRKPVLLYRLARNMMDSARRLGLAEVYVLADMTKPNTEQWLDHLGFGFIPNRDLYTREAEQLSGMRAYRWQR